MKKKGRKCFKILQFILGIYVEKNTLIHYFWLQICKCDSSSIWVYSFLAQCIVFLLFDDLNFSNSISSRSDLFMNVTHNIYHEGNFPEKNSVSLINFFSIKIQYLFYRFFCQNCNIYEYSVSKNQSQCSQFKDLKIFG